MFYIYIIYSKSADKYYIGHTNDVERRIIEHNSDPRMTYTHKFRPWDLVALFEVGENRKTAMKIEKFIKQQKSRDFILKIIISNELNGILAQLVTCLPQAGSPETSGLIRRSQVHLSAEGGSPEGGAKQI